MHNLGEQFKFNSILTKKKRRKDMQSTPVLCKVPSLPEMEKVTLLHI